MNLGEIIGNLPADIEHSQTTTVRILGMPVLKLTIRGPDDKDRDGAPEFFVDIDIGGADVYAGLVELDPKIVAQGGKALVDSVLAMLPKGK